MATTTSMMYTAIPAGGSSAPFKLSVFASPRLEGAGLTGLLHDYTLDNWTAKVQSTFATTPTLELELQPGAVLHMATVSADYLAGLEPALWDLLFPPPLTRVRPRVFQDHSKRWIRSYPIAKVEAYIQSLYNQIANAYPDRFPDLKAQTPVTELIAAVERAKPLIDAALPPRRHPREPKQYRPVPLRGPAIHPEAATEANLTALAQTLLVPHIPLAAFFEAVRFFKRGNQTPYVSAEAPYDPDSFRDRPEVPQLDFHEVMAALGDYPHLLRRLGLIIDVEVPGPAPLSSHERLRVVPPAIAGVASLTPFTRYQLNAAVGFRPLERPGGDLDRMMLRLNDQARYGVFQTDPDGNVIKVYDHAVNMSHYRKTVMEQVQRNPQAKVNQGPEESSLPALRNAGIMVVRHDRDARLWNTVSLQAGFEASPNTAILWADDLLRGYRVDVHDGSQWRSLMRRRGEYRIGGMVVAQPEPDEGYVKAESATSDDEKVPLPAQQPDLYTHGAVVSWTNYSLAGELPGKAITPDIAPDKRQREEPRLPDKQPATSFDFSATFKAERFSLPALRFGRSYRFRARATMLDGSSLAPPPSQLFPTPEPAQPVPGVGETPAVTFQRYEPVPAPMLLLLHPVREGESMEELVIRSRGGVGSPEPLPMQFDEAALFNPNNPRWVAAPKAPVSLAEAHGMLDSLFAQPPDVSRNLLKRESGAFNDIIPGSMDPHQATIVDADGLERDPTVVLPLGWKPSDPLPDSSWYFIRKDDPLPLPYLPDPLAHGVTFMVRIGAMNQFFYHPYQGTAWPEREPFKLTLTGGGAPGLQIMPLGPLSVEAQVPKGETFSVRYASAVVPPGGSGGALPEGELTLMGRWHGMTAAGRAQTAANGFQHWMLTPWRTMKLVHAVDKPLEEPRLVSLQAGKAAADTFAMLFDGQTALHSPSTGEIELRGHWQDCVDDPAAEGPEGAPYLAEKDGHVLDKKVDYGEQPTIPTLPDREVVRHEFGDTKHRWVKYYLVGTTRYREYFPHTFTDHTETETLPNGIVKKRKLISVEGPKYVTPAGTPVNILSSERPLPPDVKYIVPTFAWENTASGRRRIGRGLRVYLGRPWCSSGVDELLGVVMLPASATELQEAALRPYVSEWGSDPLFNTSGPLQALAPQHFDPSTIAASGENLRLEESPPSQSLFARVIGVTPEFDHARNLWFADLVLLPNSHYYTFARFALCRYQPHSVPGLELSRVVRPEFAQILADRTTEFVPGPEAIEILLFGPSAVSETGKHLNTLAGRPTPGPSVVAGEQGGGGGIIIIPMLAPNPGAGAGHRVVARLEQRALDATGDLGWQPATGPVGVPGEVELFAHTSNLGTNIVYWKGSVRWPRADLPSARQYRIALEEYELWETDAEVGDYVTTTAPSGKWIRSRLVFAEHYPLTP